MNILYYEKGINFHKKAQIKPIINVFFTGKLPLHAQQHFSVSHVENILVSIVKLFIVPSK